MHKIVLDTNVLISALLFGGAPEALLDEVLAQKVAAVTSPALIEELLRTLRRKFGLTEETLTVLQEEILEAFVVVIPEAIFSVLKDVPDNRVLEAAVAGQCDAIVTGDKEILALRLFQGIRIMAINDFLQDKNVAQNT